MICPYCEASIKDSSKVCAKCGEILNGEAIETKKFNIESELNKAAEEIAVLPDDSVVLAWRKKLHMILLLAFLSFLVGAMVMVYSMFIQGWFEPERTNFTFNDFYSDVDFARLDKIEAISGDGVRSLGLSTGRDYVAQNVFKEGVRLSWIEDKVLEIMDNGEKAWIFKGNRPSVTGFIDKQKKGDKSEFLKHKISTLDLAAIFKDEHGDGVEVALGDFLLVATTEQLLRDIISRAHTSVKTSLYSEATEKLGKDFDIFMFGNGQTIKDTIGSKVDLFGVSDNVALGVVSQKENAVVDFYLKPASGSGIAGRIKANEATLLSFVPALSDVAFLASGADVKDLVLEFLLGFDMKELDFESWLDKNMSIDFKNDVLVLSKEEMLLVLVKGRDGSIDPSLNVLVKLDESGEVMKKMKKIQDQIALYYGSEARNDFVLATDKVTSKLSWMPVKVATALEEIDYFGYAIKGRGFGKVYGHEMGLYSAVADNILAMSTSMTGLKMFLDYMRVGKRSVPADVMNKFEMSGTGSVSDLFKVYWDSDDMKALVPEIVMPALIKNGVVRGKYDGDVIIGRMKVMGKK